MAKSMAQQKGRTKNISKKENERKRFTAPKLVGTTHEYAEM